jgi:thiol-disulfide isomerase/thioredoxin
MVFAFFFGHRPVQADAGAPLTRIEVRTADGQPFDILHLRGGALVLYAWGDWCRVCERTTPAMLDLAREHPEVTFVFINTDAPGRLLRRGTNLPANLIETRVDAEYFGPEVMRKKRFDFAQLGLIFGVPAYYLVDGSGRIMARGNGSRYPEALAQLLAPGHPDQPVAEESRQ